MFTGIRFDITACIHFVLQYGAFRKLLDSTTVPMMEHVLLKDLTATLSTALFLHLIPPRIHPFSGMLHELD